MLKLNPITSDEHYMENTINHIEYVERNYNYINREEIKKSKSIKENVLIILNFLVDKSSVLGYLLRENIM